MRNEHGPDMVAVVSMNGILYMSGKLDLRAASGVRHYGSFIAREG